MLKKILIILLIALIVIQFFPVKRNGSPGGPSNDLIGKMNAPWVVQDILRRSCYDCHSNNTNYPWYSRVQPIGWWMQHHINEGKEELNFSAVSTYTPEQQKHKLEEIIEVIEKKEMPLTSYTWQHGNAKLSDTDRQILVNWAKSRIGDHVK